MLLISYLVGALIILLGGAVNALPAQEWDALYDLYYSTDGPNWRWSDSGIPWDFDNPDADPCVDHWDGVLCYPGEPYVAELLLSEHRLHGQLPESIANLTFIFYLDLAYNRLTGSLPSTVGDFPYLTEIYVHVNEMSGTIPATVGQLQYLEQFSLYLNKFSGTLPATMGNMTSLVGMGIYNNLFTGTLPASFGMLTNMVGLRIYNNLLRGPIPETLNGCLSMKNIGLYNNSFTGTIPSNFGEIENMQELLLHDNQLTGTIPATLSALPQLTVIMLHNNQLTGSLDGLFNATAQRILTTIQVSNNQLTGTIPAEAFELPALLTFDAVSNCFQGSLPDNICTPQLLDTLALDGLSSATSCQAALLPSLSQSYVVKNPVKGTIPTCIFALPKLQTLHLSGNGFTGTLSDDLVLGATLSDLSLSHNQFTGSIPQAVQTRAWYNLDLSYNYFSGSLSADFAPQQARVAGNFTVPGTSLSLENNRLSGPIPQAVTDSPDLSVLKGNLFSCSVDRSDLPSADSNEGNYQCGSRSLDVVYYTWLGLITVAAVLLLIIYLGIKGRLKLPESWVATATTLQKWCALPASVESTKGDISPTEAVRTLHLQYVLGLYTDIVKLCAIRAAVILIIFMPMYGLLKLKYGTHEYQYAWTVSAAFQTGKTATAVELVSLFLLLSGFLTLVYCFRASSGTNQSINVTATHITNQKEDLRSRGVLLVYVLLNGTVVVGVNIAFVFIALRESSAALFLSQIAIALFKMSWNHLSASGTMIRWLAHLLDSSATEGGLVYRTENATLLMLGVALFNTLAIPCLVVLVISPDCFYNIFEAAPAVDASYIILKCSNAEDGVCISYEPYPQTTSYHPPFTYSYQCSSSFITYYAPAFVYMCIMTTFGAPLMQMALQWLHSAFPQGSYGFKVVDYVMPLILKPIPTPSEGAHQSSRAEEGTVNPIANVHSSRTTSPATASTDTRSEKTDEASPAVVNPDQYFNATRFLLSFITYLGLLLTFGVAYPPLAPCVVLAVLSTLMYVRLCVGRFITAAQDNQQHHLVSIVDEACKNVGSASMIQAAAWMVVIFSSCYYTLFLFDTLGDELGFQGAYWVLLVVPLFPLMLYIFKTVLLFGRSQPIKANGETQDSEVAVEMRVSERASTTAHNN